MERKTPVARCDSTSRTKIRPCVKLIHPSFGGSRKLPIDVRDRDWLRGPNSFAHCSPARSALWIELTKSSRPNGLMSRATGLAPSASLRVSSSVCAVIRMTGSLHPEVASVAHSSTPFISGRSISTIRQAPVFGRSLFNNALGRSNVRTSKPAPETSRCKARRIDKSSSITIMMGFAFVTYCSSLTLNAAKYLSRRKSDHSLTTNAANALQESRRFTHNQTRF